jgi:threonine dehydratase
MSFDPSQLANFFGLKPSPLVSSLPIVSFPEKQPEKPHDSIYRNPHFGSELSNDPDYLQLILTAQVYRVAKQTALEIAPRLCISTGNTVLLKREDTQAVFSFKLRGLFMIDLSAFNRMSQLTDEQIKKGVIACSAGNHAQGVALAAKEV